ncbi:SURF1 family protein [Pararhizobium mangrovi]|uniref:SURF1-like protein n=1 Tax=Pararhizobium mangrovi TaxID=2590452 RepID=A0A506U6X7_9HYPH|nr:SURF1 family protein [Pararhizobium mangrovi]TPW28705.1 SURF1 family protein [Pararhizobium mangrovi]
MSRSTDHDARPSSRPRGGRVRTVVALVLAAVVFCILIALGTWQVQRLHWKEGLLATIHERMREPPVPLKRIEAMHSAGKPIEYRPVTVRGTFDKTKERHFLATHEGAPGFFVYTPLSTEDGETLFVNRGFVPDGRQDPASRPDSLSKGPVTVTGLAREAPAQKPSWVVPANEPKRNIFYWKDLQAMAASTGLTDARLVPFFVDAARKPGSNALPIGGVTVIDLPNNHLQYAVTWYGLALVLLAVLAGSWYRRRDTGGNERR